PAPGGGLGERALLGRSRLARLLRRLGGGLGGRRGLLGRACRGGDGGGRAFRRGRGSFLGRRRGLLGGAAARRVLLERRALRAAPRRGAGGHHGERGGRVGGAVERLGRLPGRGRPLLRAAGVVRLGDVDPPGERPLAEGRVGEQLRSAGPRLGALAVVRARTERLRPVPVRAVRFGPVRVGAVRVPTVRAGTAPVRAEQLVRPVLAPMVDRVVASPVLAAPVVAEEVVALVL